MNKYDIANRFVEKTGQWAVVYELSISRPFRRIPDSVTYQEYIVSNGWRAKASEVKKAAGWRCQVCNRHKDEITLHAHHRTYENLGHEQPGDLTVLCADCHGLYHKKGLIDG